MSPLRVTHVRRRIGSRILRHCRMCDNTDGRLSAEGECQTMRLQGKTAVVTGGATGIGWGIARALAGAGCRVAIAGRREDKLRQAVASWDRQPPILWQPVDVADRDQCAAAVRLGRQELWGRGHAGQLRGHQHPESDDGHDGSAAMGPGARHQRDRRLQLHLRRAAADARARTG